MFGRKKGFSAASTKITSARMRRSQVGTHVEQRIHHANKRMNASAVGFSSSRKKRRAARGLVDHVTPHTSSAESAREYTRRQNKRELTNQHQKKSNRSRILTIILALFCACCLALCAGVAVFVNSINAKLSLGETNVVSALSAQEANSPYYLLCAADLGKDAESSVNECAYALVRIDETERIVTVVMLPENLSLSTSADAIQTLKSVGQQGDAALISAVENFAQVKISHFAKTSAQSLSELTKEVGGVSVDLVEEVDDPSAGDVYLAAGTQVIESSSVSTLLRASNYSGGVETQAKNRAAFFCALAKRLAEPTGFAFFQQAEDISQFVQTDLELFDIASIANALREQTIFYTTCVPGKTSSTTKTSGGENTSSSSIQTSASTSVFVPSSAKWSALMGYVGAGLDPAQATSLATSIDPASFTIAVRNGTSVAGSAAQLSNLLNQAGYKVEETGNVDDYTTYPETLVIYLDDAYKTDAEALVETIGAGRVVNGGSYYTFSTDILIIIGQDYQPFA